MKTPSIGYRQGNELILNLTVKTFSLFKPTAKISPFQVNETLLDLPYAADRNKPLPGGYQHQVQGFIDDF